MEMLVVRLISPPNVIEEAVLTCATKVRLLAVNPSLSTCVPVEVLVNEML